MRIHRGKKATELEPKPLNGLSTDRFTLNVSLGELHGTSRYIEFLDRTPFADGTVTESTKLAREEGILHLKNVLACEALRARQSLGSKGGNFTTTK